jgi:queuosine precursor transporter
MSTRQSWKFYDLTLGLFVAVLMISNIASTKITSIGPLVFDGGTILFPLSYIFGDILTEVYGFKGARRIIWSGFGALLLMVVTIWVVGIMPSAGGWELQDSYRAILMLTPRIGLASFAGYLTGSFMNSVILSRLKVKMKGQKLWVRTISSTLVGEGFDTLIFCAIAFLGTLPMTVFWTLVISNYIFKVAIEVVLTPLTYKVVQFYKKYEVTDVYDVDVVYNPLGLKTE